MLGEKRDVYTNKYKEKLYFCSAVMKCEACYQGKSVREGSKDGKDSAYTKNIVEMACNIIGIVKYNVKGGV